MDVVKCNVCGGMFKESSDAIVLCNHMQSPVHMGCCSNLCSMHGGPCEHSQGMYEKMSMDSEMGNMGQEMDMGENMQMGQEMKQGQGMEMEENMDMRQNMDENMDMNKDMN